MASVGRKLGANIRTFMLEANISPDSFAERLGYSVKDVWNIIEGKIIVPPVELDRISDLLGIAKENTIKELVIADIIPDTEETYNIVELEDEKKYLLKKIF